MNDLLLTVRTFRYSFATIIVFAAWSQTLLAAGLFTSLKWSPTNAPYNQIRSMAIVVTQDKAQGSRSTPLHQAIVDGIQQKFTEAAQKKGYDIVARDVMGEWQKEMQLQRIGLGDPKSVARAGKMLNASHLLFISMNAFQHTETRSDFVNPNRKIKALVLNGKINCQIVEVETLKVVASCSDDTTDTSASSVNEAESMMSRLAERIAKRLPSKLGDK